MDEVGEGAKTLLATPDSPQRVSDGSDRGFLRTNRVLPGFPENPGGDVGEDAYQTDVVISTYVLAL